MAQYVMKYQCNVINNININNVCGNAMCIIQLMSIIILYSIWVMA